jgi:hypothetical protein
MIGQPAVVLSLDGDQRAFRPGELLRGSYGLGSLKSSDVRATELSVLWYTVGKGDEDLAVHFFERTTPHSADPVDLRAPRRFETRLPNSPLSYAGVIIKIRWCVRLRVFPFRGRELLLEEFFQLGEVPEGQLVSV